jgi:Fic family protein
VGERSKRLLEFGEGLPAQRVATALRVPLREVHRARVGAGRDREFGLLFETQAFLSRRLQAEERRVRVRELKERNPGITSRQIAVLVGCHHSTVAEDLKEAA